MVEPEMLSMGLLFGFPVVSLLLFFFSPSPVWFFVSHPFLFLIFFCGYLYLVRFLAKGGRCGLENVDLTNKVAIVTGGNTGIGKETAYELARRGCRVIIGTRDMSRGHNAVHEIKRRLRLQSESDLVFALQLDLSDLESINKFVVEVNERKLPIHFLINNAGVMMCPYGKTRDGFELQMGTNHLGHFCLTYLLMDNIKANKARVVNLSSFGHRFAKGSIDAMLDMKPEEYSSVVAYGNSKLANIWFSNYLNIRLQSSGATAYSVHPGAVDTELSRHFNALLVKILTPALRLCFKTPNEGAQTSMYVALSPTVVPGRFYSDCQLGSTTPAALDMKKSEEFWFKTLAKLGLRDK